VTVLGLSGALGHDVSAATMVNEEIVATAEDALNMFVDCKLQYLLMEDILVTKGHA
jgi:predicted NodU family carbamoyl transferase